MASGGGKRDGDGHRKKVGDIYQTVKFSAIIISESIPHLLDEVR